MRFTFFLFLSLLVLTGCDNSQSGSEHQSSDSPLTEIKKSYADSTSVVELEGLEMGATKVDLIWIEFEGGKNDVASKINAAIRDEIISDIISVSGIDEAGGVEKPSDIPSAADGFIRSYEQISDEIGGEFPWMLSMHLNKEYLSDKLLSLHLNSETYTGGAHGYNGNYYLHFDPQTGEKADVYSFISDTVALKNLLVKNFKAQYKLKDSAVMSDAGLFDMYDKTLPLPRELAFSSQGLIAIYNPYDIAPFSEGTIVVTLNDDEVKQIVSNGIKP